MSNSSLKFCDSDDELLKALYELYTCSGYLLAPPDSHSTQRPSNSTLPWSSRSLSPLSQHVLSADSSSLRPESSSSSVSGLSSLTTTDEPSTASPGQKKKKSDLPEICRMLMTQSKEEAHKLHSQTRHIRKSTISGTRQARLQKNVVCSEKNRLKKKLYTEKLEYAVSSKYNEIRDLAENIHGLQEQIQNMEFHILSKEISVQHTCALSDRRQNPQHSEDLSSFSEADFFKGLTPVPNLEIISDENQLHWADNFGAGSAQTSLGTFFPELTTRIPIEYIGSDSVPKDRVTESDPFTTST